MKRLVFVIMAGIVLLLAGCDTVQNTPSPSPSDGSFNTAQNDALTQISTLNQDDASVNWDDAAATHIQLSGNGIQVDGAGAQADGSKLTIQSAGVYVLSGVLDEGQVVIDADKQDDVRLVLSGVSITGSEHAAIYCIQANKLVITLAPGTTNVLVDAQGYAYADVDAEEPDATLFSKKDLVLNGSGTLRVTGNFNNGIGTKDDLMIYGGTYEIEAANHGIRGRDMITIADGVFHIVAGSDGLQSNNDTAADKGYIQIANGTFQIQSGNDAIQAQTTLSIAGGTFVCTAGGGSNSASASSENSYKGLKAGGDIRIGGGVFTLDCADDAVHSNAAVTILGGTFTIQTGDDGMHADGDVTIQAGTIDIQQSYEGLEGSNVYISGGNIALVASDDGINAAGGSDGEDTGGRFRPDAFMGDGGAYAISISGGDVYINANGDGLDSNGTIDISGGSIWISGPTSSGNGALDYGSGCTISGGILAAAGSAGMAQAPQATSTQPALMVYYSQTQSAHTTVELCLTDGTALLSFTPEKAFQSIVLSAPGMEENGTYTLKGNGQTLATITLTGAITTVSDSGEPVTGGMGGFGGGRDGGFGGRGQRPDAGFQEERPAKDATPPSSNAPPDGMTPPSGNAPPDGLTPPSGNAPPDDSTI